MGKVHGSLARAGKVRGQTPKVTKQDKKKKPRGRAHKRMQYNRRFVTAVVGFGKKRGPNSSENNPTTVTMFKSMMLLNGAIDPFLCELFPLCWRRLYSCGSPPSQRGQSTTSQSSLKPLSTNSFPSIMTTPHSMQEGRLSSGNLQHKSD
ncbi:hypothetical protein Cni_G06663 [Canna indica]|uniref:40S ribosomal protein S30 n=1 Tax=Canna indica TaxID=4628 RepID=A0AAQ3K260_9LILI|nr:hypothetical protein Cni_G06663 [Canna indica]